MIGHVRRTLRDILVVAWFDLAESLRSRKVLVFLVLYVGSAVAATMMFTEVLREVERELAEQLLVARTDTPGSLTQALMESPELHGVLTRMVGDASLATELLSRPPIALLYHQVALALAPIFVVLTSSDAISAEVASGSARFAVSRVPRSEWALGKLAGQALLLLVGLALGALGAWVTGWIRLASIEPLTTLAWLGRYCITAFIYAFAYLGLALGISQVTRSVPWSRALALLGLVALFAGWSWLEYTSLRDSLPVLLETAQQLFVAEHRLDLWRTGFDRVGPAAVMIVALGSTFFILGHARFVRRDA